MIWLVTLSLCIFAAYMTVMITRYGIRELVSEYAYAGGMGLFSLCIGVSAALLLPVMVAVAPEGCKFLGFLAAASLLFVAAAPHYKGDEARLHKTAAKVAGVCAVAWALAVCWEMVALSLIAYVAVMQVTESRYGWIAAEIVGMGMVYATCVYRLLIT